MHHLKLIPLFFPEHMNHVLYSFLETGMFLALLIYYIIHLYHLSKSDSKNKYNSN